ncbi:MAG: calcium/sodium antiporter [Chloroflexales bacterium]|nr:calcium/sodium antiporter [Chloroflexales bacterium]
MDVLTLVLFVLGIGLLIVGAEVLVRGASHLAVAFGISPLVVGLTVVSFATSSPELAVSLQSAFSGQADIALGNVIGSNIFNVLIILGLAAIITPLVVSQQLIRLDVPIMIGISFLMLLLGLDGRIGRLDGLLLTVGIITYISFAIWQSRRETAEVQEEYSKQATGRASQRGVAAIIKDIGMIIAGLAFLALGSNWMVDGAVVIARFLGLSELIIGLTIIAVGTSLPEVAASVVAALRGQRDMAVGNAVGSNIFNILAILGITGLVAPNGINVPSAALNFDLPIMIAVAVACLPIFFTNYSVDRWEGVLFVTYYIAYTIFIVLATTQHAALPVFSGVMGMFVLPLTVVTLFVLSVRAFRTKQYAAAPPAEYAQSKD